MRTWMGSLDALCAGDCSGCHYHRIPCRIRRIWIGFRHAQYPYAESARCALRNAARNGTRTVDLHDYREGARGVGNSDWMIARIYCTWRGALHLRNCFLQNNVNYVIIHKVTKTFTKLPVWMRICDRSSARHLWTLSHCRHCKESCVPEIDFLFVTMLVLFFFSDIFSRRLAEFVHFRWKKI